MADETIIQPELIKNEMYKVEFTSMTHEGLGVCRIGNFTVFVFDALPGEEGVIQLIKIEKNFGYGRVIRLYTKSPLRREPICPHYYSCGGCNLMHQAYEGEIAFKKNLVKETMERIGKFENLTINDVISMENTKGYRNKVQVPFGMKENKVIFGFYRQRSHDITPFSTCHIQSDLSTDLLNFIKNLCNEFHISAYNEETSQGIIRHVLIKESRKNGDIMVVIVATAARFNYQNDMIQKIVKRYPQVKSIILNVNAEPTNVILGDKFITLFGSDHIVDSIAGLDFEIGANTFYQVNPVQTEKLYAKAIEYAALTGKETVIDAYCGVGTIGLIASKHAKEIYGVEIVEEAIENAKRNAQINNISNAHFVAARSEDQIVKWNKEGIKADVIFVDPPRKGCERKFLDTVIEMKIPRIVYVSCDVATLARDLHILADNGYDVKEIQPVDMFPHTSHVETVVLLERK